MVIEIIHNRRQKEVGARSIKLKCYMTWIQIQTQDIIKIIHSTVYYIHKHHSPKTDAL